MKPKWPVVPLGQVLRERQETPTADALATGAVRIVSKIGFNDGTIQLRADGETRACHALLAKRDCSMSKVKASQW
jgi:hypothetical protein